MYCTSSQKLSYATLDRVVTNFLILYFVRVKELARQTTQLSALKALYSRCSCYDEGEEEKSKEIVRRHFVQSELYDK